MKFTLCLNGFVVLISNVIRDHHSYAMCQTLCNTGAVICYYTAGYFFGVDYVPICNAAQSACMSACKPLLYTPLFIKDWIIVLQQKNK